MKMSRYLEKLVDRFGMQNCKPKYTPCEMNVNKICNDQSELADERLYREIVGSLIYVMTATRPDLCYIVTNLSQHMARPTSTHMIIIAKLVLRYVKGTIHQKLLFRKSAEPINWIGFCDADWANSEHRRSITGYGLELSSEGPLISWKSRKQRTVALFICEAEYVSVNCHTGGKRIEGTAA
jgi:hypothetical protein